MSGPINITDAGFEIPVPLRLGQDTVQLWRAELETIGADEPRWQSVLSADELARASRFHFLNDRQSFVASRAILRIILAAYLGTEAQALSFRYSARGKPSLDAAHANSGVKFNLSHSGGIAMYAFSAGRELGIDVEQVRHNSDMEGIARRFFSPHEQLQLAALPKEERVEAFFRCWTRKEAYIKATGDGLSLPLDQFDVSLAPVEISALLATRPDGAEATNWLLQNVKAGPGYVAALCVQGRDWKLQDWSRHPAP